MSAVAVTIRGTLYDLLNRTSQQVVLMGEASLTGLSVGGGPIIPPDAPPGGGGGGPPGTPTFPIWGPPGITLPPSPGYPPVASHPLPPTPPLPPSVEQPQPGDPTTPLPPPAGQTGWPVQPMVPPPYVVINYPGIGPVIVSPPAQTNDGAPARK